LIFRIKLHWWSSLLATTVLGLVAWRLGGLNRPLGRFDSVFEAVAAGALAGAVCGLINLALHRLLLCWMDPKSYANQFEKFAIEVIGRMRPMDAIAGGLMASLGEEPFFRGVIIPACGSPVFGVFVAAVLFGFAHYVRREYMGFLIWGMGEGLLFGTLFVLSGSIIVPAVAHGIFDTVGFFYFQRLRDRRVVDGPGCERG
jgi:hypothetical protein